MTKHPPIASLESTVTLKSLMCRYYMELDEAASKRSKSIAWCTSQGPVELLRAMGFLVYFPENHGALLGATRKAARLMGHANAVGYSPDVCSYMTSDIGALIEGETPLRDTYGLSDVPKPDVLVYNTNQCRDVQEWFQFHGEHYQAPVFGIRAPRGVGDVTAPILEDVSRQMERLAVNLTAISGQSLNQTAFAQTVEYSKQTSTLWRAVLETASHRPSPITFTDVCIHMGPAVILRGTPAAVAYYRRLKAELEDRICRGQGAICNEQFRIYWEGMPIWGKLRFFAETMAAMNLSLVASTYGHSWVFDSLDPSEPFLSTAKASIELFTVRDEPTKEAFLKRIMDRFQVDGIIYHNSKTCPNCSNSRYGMPQRLTRETGIPHLVLDGDLNDLRCFSQEQTMTNLEAFAEMLAQQGATA